MGIFFSLYFHIHLAFSPFVLQAVIALYLWGQPHLRLTLYQKWRGPFFFLFYLKESVWYDRKVEGRRKIEGLVKGFWHLWLFGTREKRTEGIRDGALNPSNTLILISPKLERLLEGLHNRQHKRKDISFLPYFPHPSDFTTPSFRFFLFPTKHTLIISGGWYKDKKWYWYQHYTTKMEGQSTKFHT